jgi:glycosyltransferase involved in cell wall biosynthesis
MSPSTPPRVTVITVSFNSRATIADTIESVCAQDLDGVEHVIIDGGSTDGTQDVVARLAPHARLVSEADRGIYDAMNKGLRIASAPIAGFLNSDDMFAHRSVLSRIVSTIDGGADACYSDLIYVKRDRPTQATRYWRSGIFDANRMRHGWIPPHPTFYARLAILLRSGGFDESFGLASDFELMARLLLTERIRVQYLPEVLVRMRLGGQTNLSLRNVIAQNMQIRRALEKHCPGTSLPAWAVGKLLIRMRQFLARRQPVPEMTVIP